jgi:GMP synthase (glutamine-hydrolysing)
MRVTLIKVGETFSELKPRVGCYEDWFQKGLSPYVNDWQIVNAFQGEALPSPHTVEAVIVTGSPVSVYENLPWSVNTGQWLAQVLATDTIPVLGICYGHQLIADALQGKVERSSQGREIGVSIIDTIEEDPIFEGVTMPMQVWQSHIDEVSKIPSNAKVIASNAHTYAQGMAIGTQCRTVQWHPEMTHEIVEFYVQARANLIDQESGTGSADFIIQNLPAHLPSGHQILHNFAKYWLNK